LAHGLARLPRCACLLAISLVLRSRCAAQNSEKIQALGLGLRLRWSRIANGKPYLPLERQGAAYTYQESFAGLTPEPLDPNKRFIDSCYEDNRVDIKTGTGAFWLSTRKGAWGRMCFLRPRRGGGANFVCRVDMKNALQGILSVNAETAGCPNGECCAMCKGKVACSGVFAHTYYV